MLPKRFSTFSIMSFVQAAVLFLLLYACYTILLPFMGALIWGGIIAVSVWPAFLWLSHKLGERRTLSSVLIVLGLILALAAPIGLMIMSLGDFWPFLSQVAHALSGYHLSSPPAWLGSLPVVGQSLNQAWLGAQTDLPAMLTKLMPAINRGAVWSLAYGAKLALGLLEMLLALLVAGLLLVNGERAWRVAEGTMIKLGGAPATALPDVVSRTIRGVTTGVIGTALAQTLLCVIGLLIADVPASMVLGFLCFLLAVAQLPTLLVWLPAAGWVFYTGHTGMAIFLLLWGFLLVNTIDNVIKPMLISQGARLPLSLIFIGVIGGLLAWGMIGLFIGPTLLAVGYTLFVYWLGGDEGGNEDVLLATEPSSASAADPDDAV